MKKMQFKLRNNFGKKIEISLEPEGTIFELPYEEAVIIEITGDENPILDFQIDKGSGKLCFSIWPDKGSYELLPDDTDL
ncbi:hypothetical protein ACHRV1_12070 [Flavobacterium aquidurense]|uniref:hypothetical protein n=1 Tax=Flavobacterium aquidurense TaxID=362413 RepID=UPI00375697F7